MGLPPSGDGRGRHEGAARCGSPPRRRRRVLGDREGVAVDPHEPVDQPPPHDLERRRPLLPPQLVAVAHDRPLVGAVRDEQEAAHRGDGVEAGGGAVQHGRHVAVDGAAEGDHLVGPIVVVDRHEEERPASGVTPHRSEEAHRVGRAPEPDVAVDVGERSHIALSRTGGLPSAPRRTRRGRRSTVPCSPVGLARPRRVRPWPGRSPEGRPGQALARRAAPGAVRTSRVGHRDRLRAGPDRRSTTACRTAHPQCAPTSARDRSAAWSCRHRRQPGSGAADRLDGRRGGADAEHSLGVGEPAGGGAARQSELVGSVLHRGPAGETGEELDLVGREGRAARRRRARS